MTMELFQKKSPNKTEEYIGMPENSPSEINDYGIVPKKSPNKTEEHIGMPENTPSQNSDYGIPQK